jgi:glycosyltransferase involved in cell wall biosynthesis
MDLSILIPVFNEHDNISLCIKELVAVLETITRDYEIICIDDGSRDDSVNILLAEHLRNDKVKVIRLGRNFGKDIALSAGLAYARGRAVIPFDCDLQHPPELIPELVAKWREGYDMVVPVRFNRPGESIVRPCSCIHPCATRSLDIWR